MKRFIIAMLCSMLLFAACKGGNVEPGGLNPTPQPEQTEPIVIPSTENVQPSFDADGGSATVSFSAKGDWVASVTNTRAESWCTVQPQSGGKGSNTITIKVASNSTPDSRTAVVQLVSGSAAKNINVSQKQRDALSITTDKFEVEKEGGLVEIEVKANVQVSYSIDEKGKDWVSYFGTRALKTSYMTFKVAANESSQKREATITLSNGNLSEKITIYQNGGESAAIVISKSEYTVGAAGETIMVDVASNVDVEVVMPEVDWIKENTTRAMSTHTYYYIVSPNEEYDSRSAEIVFRNKANNLEERVKIVQSQKDAIILAAKEYNLASDACTLDFVVNANVDFTVSVNCEWIKQVNTRGLTSTDLFFDVMENTSGNSRSGMIVLSNGTIRQEIAVNQVGKTSFGISKTLVEVGSQKSSFELVITSSIGYEVKPQVDWIKQTSSTGSNGVYTHTFEVSENSSSNLREGIIVVCNDNAVCIPVTVKQAGINAYLDIAQNEYTIGSDGKTIAVEVSSNVDVEVVIPNVDWVKEDKTKTEATGKYYFIVEPNGSYDNRAYELVFRNEPNKLQKSVKISQMQKDAIIIAENEYFLPAAAGYLDFDVNTNVEFNVQVDCNWIKQVQTRGLTAKPLYFDILENNEDHERVGKIVITSGSIKQEIKVRQACKTKFSISTTLVEVGAAKATFKFTITSSIGYEVKPQVSWIKQISSTGSNGVYTHTFEVSENTSTEAREGVIVVCNDEQVCIPVTVKQAGKALFNISNTSFEVGYSKSSIEFTVTSSIGYEVKPQVSWIKQTSSTGSNGVYTHTFEVSENTSTEAREGVIVVCNDEQVCIPVTVKQAGAEPEEEDMSWVDKEFYHRSLAMRFTADWCGYCPTVAANMAEFESLYPDKVEMVHMHCSGNLKFSGAQTLMDLCDVTGYPTGIFDMRGDFNSTSSIKKQLDKTEQNYPTQTGVSYTSTLNGNNLELNLKIYAKAADNYKVTVLLLEDDIVGYQADYNYGTHYDYVHSGVVRMALTNILGDDCTTNQENQIVKKSYNISIPTKYKTENMRVLVYVQRPYGNQSLIDNTSYGDYYVDNSVSGKLGSDLKLGLIENLSGGGNEDILPDEDIDF